MAYQPGPKELALKAMRESNAEKRKEVSPQALREKIKTVKGGGKKKAKKGAKR